MCFRGSSSRDYWFIWTHDTARAMAWAQAPTYADAARYWYEVGILRVDLGPNARIGGEDGPAGR